MKLLCLLLFFFPVLMHSQEMREENKTKTQTYLTDLPEEELVSDENLRLDFHGKEIFVFRTFEDYQNNVSEKIGYFWRYAEKRIDGWREDKSDFSLNPCDIWGFTIDDKTFRCLRKSNPLLIITLQEKVFYANGYFFLHGWNNYSESTKFFYSDDIESPVYSLNDFMSNNKGNLRYLPVFQCINDARRGKKQEVNSKIYICLKNFE